MQGSPLSVRENIQRTRSRQREKKEEKLTQAREMCLRVEVNAQSERLFNKLHSAKVNDY